MPKEPAQERCRNCLSELSGPYCAECGQHQLDLDRPFRELIAEGLATFVAFDSRLIRTLWPLLGRPGFLTKEFLAGRRVRYVHPFKLYFVFSLLFFLAVSFSGYSVIRISDDPVETVVAFQSDAPGDSGGEQTADGQPEETGSPEVGSPSVLDVLLAPMAKVADEDPVFLNRMFIDKLAKSMIILVPVFAVLLQVLFWKPRYVAHLVFSLYLHSFSFLVLVVGIAFDIGAGSGKGEGPGGAVAAVLVCIYTFLALRRVYGQGRFKTFFKFIVLGLGYIVALMVTMIFTLALTAASI